MIVSAALALALAGALTGCGDNAAPEDMTISTLRLIGQQILPRRMEFEGTVVGGFSGIDYDAAHERYLLISDDRTTADSPNPPRMYTAALAFDESGFTEVTLLSTFPMKRPDGSVYPKVPDPDVADPESVRIDPNTGNYVWVSEGDRALTAMPPRLIDPFIREIQPDGTAVRSYAVPAMFTMEAVEMGPRGNAVFEGLSFTPDRSRVAVITEGALFQDGPAATTLAGTVSRLTMFDAVTGEAAAQHAYPVERVQAEPVPAGAFTVNGPDEILALSRTRFLVLERSFSVGVIGNQVRLYEIDISEATDVLPMAALAGATYAPVSKRMVLDFETLKDTLGGIANLEGLTFGPRLVNGHASLVVVADDNFPTADSLTDKNQILVFEIMP